MIYAILSLSNAWVVIEFLARVTREVPPAEQELLPLFEKLCSSADSVTFVLLTLNYYSTCFLFKIVFVSFKRKMIWAASGTITFSQHLSSPQVVSGVLGARSSVFCVVCCRPLFACLLSLFIRSLYDGFRLNLWYLQSSLNSIWKLTFWYSIIQYSDLASCMHCMTLNTYNNQSKNVNCTLQHECILFVWSFYGYIPECKQQLRTVKKYTQIRDIAHFKSGL